MYIRQKHCDWMGKYLAGRKESRFSSRVTLEWNKMKMFYNISKGFFPLLVWIHVAKMVGYAN